MDLDYTRDRIDRKSIYGSVFILLRDLLAWYSRKQQSVSTSITEAKYIALYYRSKEAMWFRELFKELGFI